MDAAHSHGKRMKNQSKIGVHENRIRGGMSACKYWEFAT